MIASTSFPPCCSQHGMLDRYYQHDDEQIFQAWQTRSHAKIASLNQDAATRFYRFYAQIESPLTKRLCSVAFTLIFPLGLYLLYGARQIQQIEELCQAEKAVHELWNQRQQSGNSEETIHVSDLTDVFALLVGDAARYAVIPAEKMLHLPICCIARRAIKFQG